jgi:ATP/maltotriose-dependent transcriptional regulator MalT
LSELGRSILARRVIRRRPFCVISWSTSRSVQLAEVQDRVAFQAGLEREVELLQRLACREPGGLDAATSRAPEFAAELFASNNTVRTHLRHIYAKLDAHSRSEAVARARELGLLA